MKSCEEMTRDVLERRDEEVVRIRKRRKTVAGLASGIAVCALAVLVLPGILKRPVTPAGPNTAADPQTIVWTAEAGSAVSGGIIANAEGKGSTVVADKLQDAMDKASPDDYLAFTIGMVFHTDPNDPLDRLKNLTGKTETMDAKGLKYKETEEALDAAARKVIEKIVQEQDITEVEASARAENDPDVIAAKKARLEALQDSNVVRARAYNAEKQSVIELLKEKGFTVLCTCWDDGFGGYTMIGNCIAVCAGTGEMIESLAASDFGDDVDGICLYATRPIDDSDTQPPAGKTLRQGSKLTVGLEEKYKQNGGAPVRVVVHIGWTGEKAEPDSFWLTSDAVEPMLKEDERIIELKSGSWTFTADLSYERAVELCADKKVAFISMDGEAESNDIFELRAVPE